ncbi:unnamed protein product [Arctogadus glacialis]
MSESHLMGFLVLFLSILQTESAIGILNSINDLKKIPFGQSVPQHSLVLLHWFASTIEIDNNDAIELTFEPNHGDYGTHHYGNYERVLDQLPFGQRYYTLGNINPMINNNGNSLPSYFTGQINHLLGGEELNRARIIFALSYRNTIGRVYITQHYQANQNQGTVYDPVHTYRITINLLRELRVFSFDRREQSELSEIGGNIGSGINDHKLSSVRNTWGQLACVGLLLFIVINERNRPCDRAREPKLTPKRNVRASAIWSTMSESHLMGFLVLFLSFLPTASTIGILNSINDLKKIPFGRSVPKHSLVLLHWFANTIELSNNNRLELNFDRGDYGAHHYVNFQEFLDPLPSGHQYFTLGNINPMINNQRRPSYFTNDLNHLLGGEVQNRARIIFTLSSQNTIGQVYITQHYQADQGQGTLYDPEHTYRITINLLRELRVFSLDRGQHSELSEIGGDFGSSIDYHELSSLRNTWGQLACVGLLLFIVINQRNVPCRPNRAREPPQPLGEDQCLTLCLALGFLAIRAVSSDDGRKDCSPILNCSLTDAAPPHYSRVSFTVKQKVKLKIYSITDQDREVRQRQKRFHTNTEQTPNRSNMSESHLMGFLVLFLSVLPTESTIGILNSINDLKKIPFGQSVPKHSLVLLHWFANTIELSNNNRLNFYPDHGDYGAHHYGNFQDFLAPLPIGHRYFTLGNINPMINNQRRSLPDYFTNDLNHLLGREVLNRARIIFTLSSQNTIGQVYITQHYQDNQNQGTVYDPVHTYRITINLLRELRVFSWDRRSHSELSEIVGDFRSSIEYYKLSSLRNTWGQLACVGLLLFIVINQRNVPCSLKSARETKRLPEHNVQASATPQMYNLQSYNNYSPPPQPRGEDQCLTVCLALGFLAVILIIAVAVYVHKFRY